MTILPSLGAKGCKRSLNPFSLPASTLLEFSHAASVRRAPATASSALMLWMRFNWMNFGLQIPPSATAFLCSTETSAVQKTGQITHIFLPRCSRNVSILRLQASKRVFVLVPSFASLNSCCKCQQWRIKFIIQSPKSQPLFASVIFTICTAVTSCSHQVRKNL